MIHIGRLKRDCLSHWSKTPAITCTTYQVHHQHQQIFLLNTLKTLQVALSKGIKKKEAWETSWIAETVIAVQITLWMLQKSVSTCFMFEFKLHSNPWSKLGVGSQARREFMAFYCALSAHCSCSVMNSEKPKFWVLVYLLVIPECLFQGAPSPQVLPVHQVLLFLPVKDTRLSITTALKT